MTFDDLYNKLLTKYPAYKNYITYGDYLDIYVTDEPAKQNHLTRFFRVNTITDAPNKLLLFCPWTAGHFKSAEIEDVGINGAEPRDKFGSIPEIYEYITTLWHNYEAAVQYFDKVYKELPYVIETLQKLGFIKQPGQEVGGFVVPPNMILAIDPIDVEVRFPNLYFLGYKISIYRERELLDYYESKNINDCINFLQED